MVMRPRSRAASPGAVPDVVEQDVIGELGELGRDVAYGAAAAADLAGLLCVGLLGPAHWAASCWAVAYCWSVTGSSHVVGSDPSGLASRSA